MLLGCATPLPSNATTPATVPASLQVVFAYTVNVTPPVGVIPATPVTLAQSCTTVPIATVVVTAWLAACTAVLTAGTCRKVNPPRPPVPPGVVTDTLPLDPIPTTAVISVLDTTVNDCAAVPPKLTPVAPLSTVPVIVTVAPCPADVGAKLVIVGGGITVKSVLLAATPPGVVTLIGPVVAAGGTVAWISVAEATPKLALTPLKVTPLASVKSVPVMVTLAPTAALAGAKLVIVGGGITVKSVLLAATPPGVVTLIGPVVAADGTVAWISVAEATPKLALTPLKVTSLASVKSVPVMVTPAPTAPLAGAKLVITGGGMAAKGSQVPVKAL